MDKSFHRQESDAQQTRSILDSLHIFDSTLLLIRYSLNWLAGLIWLTEKEQEDAGLYLGRLRDE